MENNENVISHVPVHQNKYHYSVLLLCTNKNKCCFEVKLTMTKICQVLPEKIAFKPKNRNRN